MALKRDRLDLQSLLLQYVLPGIGANREVQKFIRSDEVENMKLRFLISFPINDSSILEFCTFLIGDRMSTDRLDTRTGW